MGHLVPPVCLIKTYPFPRSFYSDRITITEDSVVWVMDNKKTFKARNVLGLLLKNLANVTLKIYS